jgi:hypothetical protein
MSSGVVAATTFIGACTTGQTSVWFGMTADGVRFGPPSVMSVDSSCGLSGDGGLQPKPAIVALGRSCTAHGTGSSNPLPSSGESGTNSSSTLHHLLPQFIEAWSLTNTQAGWLAGITSAGYMFAVIPLVSLTDRQLYLASSVLSALCVPTRPNRNDSDAPMVNELVYLRESPFSKKRPASGARRSGLLQAMTI